MKINLEYQFEKINFNENFYLLLHMNKEYENYPPHWHMATEIIMPVNGRYTVACSKETFILNEYDILIVPAGELHELMAPPTGLRLILQFDSLLLRTIGGFPNLLITLEQLRLITLHTAPEIHSVIKNHLLSIGNEYENQETLAYAAIYSRIIDIYVTLARYYINSEMLMNNVKPNKQKEYIEKINSALDYILKHFTEELNLEAISKVAGFSKFHFTRLFRQLTGYSFYDYLTKLRVKKAESLLLNPTITITDVAMQSGFASISTFNRVFKHSKNCTPTEYKALYCLNQKGIMISESMTNNQ